MRCATKSDIDHKVEKYQNQNKELSDLLKLHGEIMKVLIEHRDRLINENKTKYEKELIFNKDKLKSLAEKNSYLLNDYELNIDPRHFFDIYNQVVRVVKELDHRLEDNLSYFKDSVLKNIDTIIKLLQDERYSSDFKSTRNKLFKLLEVNSYFNENDDESDFDPNILSFLLFYSLVPFYTSFTACLPADVDTSGWTKGNCPICYSKPIISKLRAEDGARILHCWLCSFEWEYPRLQCPYCENNEFNKLGYYYADEDSSRRASVCSECTKYIKTISLGDIVGDINSELENIFTLPLDYLAQRKGYMPGGGMPLG